MFEEIVIKELAKEFNNAEFDVRIQKDKGKQVNMTLTGTQCDMTTAYLILGKTIAEHIHLNDLDMEICKKLAEYINDNAETTKIDVSDLDEDD